MNITDTVQSDTVQANHRFAAHKAHNIIRVYFHRLHEMTFSHHFIYVINRFPFK